MKAIMISFDQAHYENVIAVLDRTNARGFTMVPTTYGRGTKTGDPHFGSHAWPSMCSTIITIVDEEQASALLTRLKALDEESEMLGLRAFEWSIDNMI
ncbi:MAG: hypothetical protein KBT06_08090 [Prevotellaceae bacterium]|nr:hypothetical protein [Candidatus Colivivens equi]MCQ2077684.1 hypothetical protein [Bacteroidaceae bacterium]